MTQEFTLGPAILFCPADRPDRYLKAAQRADAIIIDLEDAVNAEDRPAARKAIREFFSSPSNIEQVPDLLDRVIVRINEVGTPDFDADVTALADVGIQWVMVPKSETAQALDVVAEQLPGTGVVALVETAMGFVNLPQIAAHGAVAALMWGAEDLMASLGGSTSRHVDSTYRDVARYARAQTLMTSAAFGKAAIDSIHTDLKNVEAIATEAADAVASGFTAKAAIHPAQTEPIREAFTPTVEELAEAQELLAAVGDATGAVQFRGAMVDGPLIKQAQRIVARAKR